MYIVIECHGGPEYAIIVTHEDGTNKIFDTAVEAMVEVNDCQDGLIVQVA